VALHWYEDLTYSHNFDSHPVFLACLKDEDEGGIMGFVDVWRCSHHICAGLDMLLTDWELE
jgi:hypothetical protein